MPLTGEVEYGRGQRAKQPKRLWESETEESDEDEEAVLSCRQQVHLFDVCICKIETLPICSDSDLRRWTICTCKPTLSHKY